MTKEEIAIKRKELLQAITEGNMDSDVAQKEFEKLDEQLSKAVAKESENAAQVKMIWKRNEDILRKMATKYLPGEDGKVPDAKLTTFMSSAGGVLNDLCFQDNQKYAAIVGGSDQTFEDWAKGFAESLGLTAQEAKQADGAESQDTDKLDADAKENAKTIDASGISSAQGITPTINGSDGKKASEEEIEAFDHVFREPPPGYTTEQFERDYRTLGEAITKAETELNIKEHSLPEFAQQLNR